MNTYRVSYYEPLNIEPIYQKEFQAKNEDHAENLAVDDCYDIVLEKYLATNKCPDKANERAENEFSTYKCFVLDMAEHEEAVQDKIYADCVGDDFDY